jgi:hypothetical protein
MTKLTDEQKEKLIDELAQKWTDDMDTDAFMEFFYDKQVADLEGLDDSELVDLAEENDIDVE